jgi:cobalt-zinc-cadmium efflux system outer membrane protein
MARAFPVAVGRLLTALLALVAAPAGAQALTFSEALSEARAHAFDGRAAEARLEQARADVVAARQLTNPAVLLQGGPSIGCFGERCRDGSPALNAQLSDQAALSQLLFGKVGLRTEVAEAGVRASALQRDDALRAVVASVKTQFVAALIAEQTARFTAEVRDAAEETSTLFAARLKAGAVDDADVARVEVARLEAAQALDAAQRLTTTQRSTLAYLLGRSAGAPLPRPEGGRWLTTAPQPGLDGESLERLLEVARAQRPDLRAQAEALAQARAQAQLARRARIPDVTVSVAFNVQGQAPSYSNPPNLMAGLGLPLPVLNQQRGEVERADAVVREQEALVDEAEAQVRTDVETAFAAWDLARVQAERMERGGLLASARRARELVSVQYQRGAASLLELLDAQRTFIAVSLEYLGVVQAYWSAVFRLEAAVGQEFTS